ncbi:predicted protein [Nematostella vectensis]|uniref:Uncharacterized protein n=1 Tax=Nematostella vectensis TaxID=45351 RepID=A7RR55_NEMVE|nr:predicted protein [Nematostella vectensis]|eukprot:XP_001638116.1 predicted protein [Nematostella vectensis]
MGVSPLYTTEKRLNVLPTQTGEDVSELSHQTPNGILESWFKDITGLIEMENQTHFANREVNSIKSELDEFADWILSYVPEPVKKTAKEAVDKRVKRLKERIKRLHGEAEDRFTPKEQKTALKGYLKTYGIAGQEGYGPKEFITKIRPKVIKLVNDRKKPIKVKFVFTCRKMRVPFVVYADFESFTENIDTCSPDESRSFTKQYQKHKPSGFCYLIKCSIDDGVFSPKLVQRTVQGSAEDVAQLFVESLESDIKEIYNKFKFPKEVVVDRFTNKEGKQVDVKRDIRFIDSFKFMSASLDSLVKNLPRESFKNLMIHYKGEQLQLLLRKGVFPYDWMDGGGEAKKCKGVKRAVVKKSIGFDDYKDCLFGKEPQMRMMNVIRSHGHNVYTETVNKRALSHEDDKRIICDDGIHTHAHGYLGSV